MRRQARISTGGALVVRTASALQVWLWLLIFVFQNEFRISRSIQPGYLDFDNLPETNFTCEGKVIGGYYADLETSCQMFHVCTVGQHDEPMDIKFLCLNGTVFDQETRVCERVDEVDCTKSEKFYSLNLELYGSTLPPVTKTEAAKTQSTEKSSPAPSHEQADPSVDEPNIPFNKNDKPQHEDSTDDPIVDVISDTPPKPPIDYAHPTNPALTGHPDHLEPIEENQEEEEIDSEDADYDDEDYSKTPTTTYVPSTTTKAPRTSTLPPLSITSQQPSPIPQSTSPPSPTHSSIASPTHSSIASPTLSSSPSASPTLDPALLSPQEFIYRHRGPGSEAISFQRQSFRPADGVYITHAPPPQQQSFEHYQYESSRTAPRPGASRPAPFSQRPTPFRVTTLDPRDQLSRPGPSSQSSERHETAVKHRQTYLPPLPVQRPYDPYYYDRKRSEEVHSENESSLAARSVAPPRVTERPPAKPKSPPRVIVTASASVSDSNGKRLNYTVGNVVSAVKPIVPINYDDYKESDLIFDPFFLDVPKLQKRRKTRGSQGKRKVFSVPATANIAPELVVPIAKVTTPSVSSQATTSLRSSTSPALTTTTAAWNPNDYVDDNYEPQAYIPPIPPVVLLPYDRTKFKKQEGTSTNGLSDAILRQESKDWKEESKPKSLPAAQSTSSQFAAVVPGPAAAPPSPAHTHPAGLLCDGC